MSGIQGVRGGRVVLRRLLLMVEYWVRRIGVRLLEDLRLKFKVERSSGVDKDA